MPRHTPAITAVPTLSAGGGECRVAIIFSTERLFAFKSGGPGQKFRLVCSVTSTATIGSLRCMP
jgi:hypothetical protein